MAPDPADKTDDSVEELAASGAVDVLAHPDLAKVAGHLGEIGEGVVVEAVIPVEMGLKAWQGQRDDNGDSHLGDREWPEPGDPARDPPLRRPVRMLQQPRWLARRQPRIQLRSQSPLQRGQPQPRKKMLLK